MGNATLNSESCYEMRKFSPSSEGCSANNLDNLIFSVWRPIAEQNIFTTDSRQLHTFRTLKHTFKKLFSVQGAFFPNPSGLMYGFHIMLNVLLP